MEHFEPEQRRVTPAETKERESVFLEIQTELLRRAECTNKEDNERCYKWIQKYAEKLRSIADSSPELLEEWKTDPKTALEKIEIRLYMREDA